MNTTAQALAPGAQTQEMADGFQLVIDALKLNGIDTIYALPGIPITDLTRRAQADGMRVLSFRHEQNAGYAASIAGFLTQKPGICLTVSAPGFLNGLNALAHATTNCFPMILISGSSEREIVDLQQGDYEELDQLAIAKPLAKAAYRVLHAEDIGVGIARAIRAAVDGVEISCQAATSASANASSLMWSGSLTRRRCSVQRTPNSMAANSSSSAAGSQNGWPSASSADTPRSGMRKRIGPSHAPSLSAMKAPMARFSSGVVRIRVTCALCL